MLFQFISSYSSLKIYQYPLPSVVPYFTPDEMENMGVFSEDAEKNYYGVSTP